MKLDLRAIIVTTLGLAIAAYFSLVPSWVAIVSAVVASAAIGQNMRQARVKARQAEIEEQKAMSLYAPELVGKDFVTAANLVFSEGAIFKEKMPVDVYEIYSIALLEKIAEHSADGRSAPFWLPLALQRQVEQDIANNFTEEEIAKATSAKHESDA